MGLDTGAGLVIGKLMARISNQPNVATLEARSLFLVGDETGTRITNPKELARRTGCHERTIREYLKVWQGERNEMLKSVHDGSLVVELSEETLNFAKQDESWVRKRMNDLKIEFEELETIEDKLFGLLDSWDESMGLDLKKFDKLESMLEKYLKTCGTKKAVVSQFLTLKKAWDSISGLDTRMKAGEAALKAIATTQAKHEAQEALEQRAKDRMRDATPSDDEAGELTVFDQG